MLGKGAMIDDFFGNFGLIWKHACVDVNDYFFGMKRNARVKVPILVSHIGTDECHQNP